MKNITRLLLLFSSVLMVLPRDSLAETVLRLETAFNPKNSNASPQPLPQRIIQEAYQRLNTKIELVHYENAGQALWLVNSGVIDGEVARGSDLEKQYQNLLRVNVPLITQALHAYTKEIDFPVNGWQSLKPYRIAYVRDLKIIENNLKELHIKNEPVNTINQAFMMLSHGRVDVVIADAERSAGVLAAFPDIKMLSPAIASFSIYHYLHKKHANLVPKVEAVLQQINIPRK